MPLLPGGLPLSFGPVGTEILAYTSALTGQTIVFGDNTLPTVIYKGISGVGVAAGEHYAVDTAYRPGSQFVRSRKTAQQLKVDLSVFGDPNAPDVRASLFSTQDQILAVLEPATTVAGTLTKVTTDGIARQLYNVQYVGGFETEDKASNRAYLSLELLFEAYDPTWYSQVVHTVAVGSASDLFGWSVPMVVPLVINGQASGTINCPNAGNINSRPLFTFSGPLTNFSLTNGSNGQSFSITQNLNSGDTLTVDSKAGAVTYTPSGGSPTPLYSAFAGNRQFILLQPGTNNLTFRRDVAGNNQCQVTYQDTWNHG